MMNVCMVFVTAPNQDVAAMLARTVVDEGLAACGNLIPRVRSIYRWQGAVHDDEESLVVFKTTEGAAGGLRDRVFVLGCRFGEREKLKAGGSGPIWGVQ